MPNVGTERWIGLVVAKFDQNRDILVLWRERMHGEFTEPAAEVDQILRADILVAKDQQLVLRERILNCVAVFVRYRLAQVDAGDLGAEMSTHPRDRQAGVFCDDRSTLEATNRLVHDEATPAMNRGSCCGFVILTARRGSDASRALALQD